MTSRRPRPAELAAMLRAARHAGASTQPIDRRRLALGVLVLAASATALSATEVSGFSHARARRPFLSTPHGFVTPREYQWSAEESRMRALRSSALVVGSSLAITSGALAQNAVQWRVEDGGNGHWYAVDATESGWIGARARAIARGADLASLESEAEWTAVVANLPTVYIGYLVGGTQASGSGSTDSGWSWLTGTPIAANMLLADDNPCGVFTPGIEDNQQNFLHTCCDSYMFGDINDGGGCLIPLKSIVEWSADCNNDGIVDYGQILAGELVDTNGNNIPDCCEQGVDCRFTAVQWRVEDGGNGHWYDGFTSSDGVTWPHASLGAQAVGGHLVSLHSAEEQTFIWAIAGSTRMWAAGVGPWLGGYQPAGSREPAGGWQWSSGEPWTWSDWVSPEPSNGCAAHPEEALMYFPLVGTTPAANWNDYPAEVPCAGYPLPRSYLVEWSADCNSDGIVDYGQIRSGELADANGNYTPDCCEATPPCGPCLADVDGSGAVNGVDLAAILNTWGTSGGKYPGADVNSDGIVNGADLAEVLNSWGPCP